MVSYLASPSSTRSSHYAKSWKRPTKNKSTHTIFLFDYKAAFDSPIRNRVFATMSELGITAMQIRLYRMTLINSCSSVKVGMGLSEPFDTLRGFRQGNPLSCDLLNFVMDSILRKAGVHRSGTIFQKSVQLLAYADDIDIIGRTKRDVTAAFSAIERESNCHKLNHNYPEANFNL